MPQCATGNTRNFAFNEIEPAETYKRGSIYEAELAECMEMDNWSELQLATWRKKLASALLDAYRYVPHYSEALAAVRREDMYDDPTGVLSTLPIITRSAIRSAGASMH